MKASKGIQKPSTALMQDLELVTFSPCKMASLQNIRRQEKH